MIETRALTKQYREITALDDCTLSIGEGEVFGLLGPNGAGKTTLLRLVLGFLRPTSGTARVNDQDCYQERVAVHRQVAYLPGEARLFRTMRGRDVLKFFCGIRSDISLDAARAVAQRLELDLSRWVGFMSTGMRQKLALSVVMSVDSPILILDEPTANLDPTVRSEVMNMVTEARQAGRTVVFSSHVLSEVEDTCCRVGILRRGKLVHTQAMDTLKRQHRITARLKNGHLPEIPGALREQMTVSRLADDRLRIETPGELSSILHWLANADLEDVHVQPVGLRSVYDRFHHDRERDQEEVVEA